MSSYSRNSSRKPSQALHLALAAALLAGSAAHAADQPHTFVLTAFSNGAAGKSLMSGKYDAAVQELGSKSQALTLDTDSLSTNRCVAYSVTKQLEAAHVACDRAVTEAQQDVANLPTSMFWARREYKEYAALAFSNRAVLNWLSNDANAAREDLKKAQSISPRADFVAHNLSALQNRNAVAQLTVVTKN
jgi:tetratricopeptide (TPR) repeat protein